MLRKPAGSERGRRSRTRSLTAGFCSINIQYIETIRPHDEIKGLNSKNAKVFYENIKMLGGVL